MSRSSMKYHPETDKQEHDRTSRTKKVMLWGWDSDNLQAVKLAANSDGELTVNTGGGETALIADSTTTADVTYVGKANIGAATSADSWQIKKIDETVADVATITWADGDDSFNNIWDDRASLSYS